MLRAARACGDGRRGCRRTGTHVVRSVPSQSWNACIGRGASGGPSGSAPNHRLLVRHTLRRTAARTQHHTTLCASHAPQLALLLLCRFLSAIDHAGWGRPARETERRRWHGPTRIGLLLLLALPLAAPRGEPPGPHRRLV